MSYQITAVVYVGCDLDQVFCSFSLLGNYCICIVFAYPED